MTQKLESLQLPVLGPDEAAVQRLVLMARALSDPIRVRMLRLMALGRGCCGLPPASSIVRTADEPEGICVCEFEERFNLGQSKVSYHLRCLKEAGLVKEDARGKWTFYSLNRRAIEEMLALIQQQLNPAR